MFTFSWSDRGVLNQVCGTDTAMLSLADLFEGRCIEFAISNRNGRVYPDYFQRGTYLYWM